MAQRLIMLAMVAVLCGCSSSKPPFTTHGSDRSIRATQSMRTLYATLPAHVRVNAVLAAAEQTLLARGYSVTRAALTSDAGTILAEPPQPSSTDQVKIRAYVYGSGTRIEITVKHWGDGDRARAILDDILRRLGL